MRPSIARPSARLKTGAAIIATAALAVGGAVVASPGHAVTLQIDDALFDWQVNAESGGAAPLPGTCQFLVAGEVADTGGSNGFNESFYTATAGNTTIVKPDADGVDHTATWDDKCLDPDGKRTTTAAGSTSGNRVQITGGTGTIDPETDTGQIQWEGSWTFVYYSGMTYWTVNDPRLEVENGKGRIVGTFTGYEASMDDPGQWAPLPAQEGTIANFQDATVDLTEDGFSVTPDYLGVEVDTADAGFDQQRTGDTWGAFPQDWVDFNARTGQSAYWFSSGGLFDPKKPTKPITVSYTAQEIELGQPTGLTAEDVTTDSAHVTWQPVDGAEGYELEYSAGDSGWQQAEVSGASADLTGLVADADHSVRVRAVSGETRSPWAFCSFRTSAASRPTTTHQVTGANSSDGLTVQVSGTDYVQDRIPPTSEGVAPGPMSSIGMGLVPRSTANAQVSSETAIGYAASLLRFVTGGALDVDLNAAAGDLDAKTDYDVVVWHATQGGNAGGGALLYRAAVELSNEQKEDLFDGAATAVPPVDDLTTSSLGDTFLTLRWSADSSYTTNIRWRKASIEEFAARDKRQIAGWGTYTSITGLERGTEYVFEIERARGGVWSETRQYRFTTLESVPQAGKPEPVADTVTDTTIDLSWEATENAVDYRVAWSVPGSSTTSSNTSRGATSYTVSGLAPDTEYLVTVRALTDLGVESEPGSITVRTTPEGGVPTEEPTEEPTEDPTEEPTEDPTDDPTDEPTVEPTDDPSGEPSEEPSEEPTTEPTEDSTDEPTTEPTEEPTTEPTEEPTVEPTTEPTVEPTDEPTVEPTNEPTVEPTDDPSDESDDAGNGSDDGRSGDDSGSGDSGSGGGDGGALPRTGTTLTTLFAGIGAILVGVGAVVVARRRA